MAPTHQQTVRTETASAVSSITHSNLAVGSGANRSLVAHLLFLDSGSSPHVDSVVFNTSENFTFRKMSRYDLGGGNYLSVEIWTLDNPSNVTANVVATLSETISAGYGLAIVISEYTGANNGVGTNTGASTGDGDPGDCSFTTISASSLVIWGMAGYQGGVQEYTDGGEAQRMRDNIGYMGYIIWDEASVAGTSSISVVNSAQYWSLAGIELNGATVSSLVPPNISKRMSHLLAR